MSVKLKNILGWVLIPRIDDKLMIGWFEDRHIAAENKILEILLTTTDSSDALILLVVKGGTFLREGGHFLMKLSPDSLS